MNDSESSIFELVRGRAPLIVSIPHVGTRVPAEIEREFTPEARALTDTDWHVERLYDFVSELGASVLAAHYSRYVIDLNRPPDDASLYPGRPDWTVSHAQLRRRCRSTAARSTPCRVARLNSRRERYWSPTTTGLPV